MKEHIAREKLCPMAMNTGENNWTRKCQGSDCIAWVCKTKTEHKPKEASASPDDGWTEGFFNTTQYRRIRTDEGYCDMVPKECSCGQ